MKKGAGAGIDGMNFELELVGAYKGIYMDEKALVNSYGVKYCTAEVKKGRLQVYVNPSLAIRENNVESFTKSDMEQIPMIKKNVIEGLQCLLENEGIKCDVRQSLLKQIECGITQRVAGESTCSQAMNLFNRSFDRTNIFQHFSSECPQFKENEFFKTSRKNYYHIKVYDKSFDELRKGNNVEDKLLRIEIQFLQRTIHNLFETKATLEDVLQKKSLIKVIAEFNKIFSEEIIEGHIKPCLTAIRKLIFNRLTQTDNLDKTLARYGELVVDDKVVRGALKKWYAERGMPDYSRQAMYELKKYELPKDVILTIKEFHNCCC